MNMRVIESGPKWNRQKGRHGFVLVIVLWIALGLVAVVLLFGEGMKMEYRAAANSAGGYEADQAIAGARRYLLYSLSQLTTPGTIPEVATYPVEDVPIGDSAFWLVGRTDQDLLTTPDTPAFGFTDEASKLNLNTATLEQLQMLPNMPAELAASIIDWRDDDSTPQDSGAESEYYAMTSPAYSCKNAKFESVEELHLVRGATWDVLFGEDANLNGILDPNENDGDASFPSDDGDGVLKKGILDFVTIYSEEPNKKPDGSNRINITDTNQAGELRTYLSTTLEASRAEQIVTAFQAPGGGPIRSVLQFYLKCGIKAEEAAKIEGGLTTSGDPTLVGLVNVNTAPREVLICLPGIGENFADALIALRRTKTADQLTTVFWVLEVLDAANATQAGRFITAHTYRLSADVTAVASGGRAVRRSWMVFDASTTTPTLLYSRDRSDLGWPLGTALRDEFDNQQELQRKGTQ